jgi:aryl-alcohol dehydrogenase-like predicted oxidoreductase
MWCLVSSIRPRAVGRTRLETEARSDLQPTPCWFLTTKTQTRTAKDAEQDLATSLRLLKTDHVDVWQVHAVQRLAHLLRSLNPTECLRYALSQPGVHVAICGAGTQGQMETTSGPFETSGG